MRKSHPIFLLALCLFTSPLFAQKEFNVWKSIDCYPGLEYSQQRSTGNGNRESHELSIKFRHHYEKVINFSYAIRDSGGKSTLGSGDITLDAGDDKTIQFNLSDSENLRVIITNFRLGGEGGDLIPCGADSDDSEKKKDGDKKTDDEDKKEKKKETEVSAIIPAGGVAASAIVIGAGEKNEGGRKEGQEKESQDKKAGDQEDKKSQTEESERETESKEKTGIKEKETEDVKAEEEAKGKEKERKEVELKEGEQQEGEKIENKGAVKEKETEGGDRKEGEVKEGELKEGENKESQKKEGEAKEHAEPEIEKQATSPVVTTSETENKGTQEIQPVTENKPIEKINEVTNPPTEEKQTPPVEKTVEKSKSEETPIVVPAPIEQKTPEQEPVKHEEQPKPVEPTPKPEPTVPPIETPVKESKTEESAPVTETKAKEVPEPVVEEKEVREEKTAEGETVEEAEEEKSLPAEEKGEEAGEAKEGEGAGETEKEEEEEATNDDLKRRIEEGNQRQQEADANQNQMASQLGDILSAEGGGDVYTRLAIGMNLEGGLAVQAVPMVENASSSTGAITPYSASTLPINLGIYAKPELWLLRNQYFGLGVDYRVIITYSVLAGGGITSTALASGGNLRVQAGLKHFKLHFQGGKENRNGTYSNDHDVTNNALGAGTNNSIYSDGDYNYQVTNTGFGALIDFRDYNNKEAFIKYTLSYERPDFLPAANASIKTHTIHVRYFLDIICTYGNKYPIAGKPSYTYLTSDKNKDYFFFGLGKTFKIFKSK